jgi:hypothetical protein
VRLNQSIEFVSARAPLIVGVSLFAAVLGASTSGPPLVFYLLAILLTVMAAVVWARRGASNLFKSEEQLGFKRNRDEISFRLMAQGTPRGYHALATLCFVALVMTGFRFPYLATVIAGIMLTLAWGEDRRRYPADGPPTDNN